jgi:hypothetical protein
MGSPNKIKLFLFFKKNFPNLKFFNALINDKKMKLTPRMMSGYDLDVNE